MKIVIFACVVALAFTANFNAGWTADASEADGAAWCVAKIGAAHASKDAGAHKASINLAGYTPPAAETTDDSSSRLLEDEAASTNTITGVKACGYMEVAKVGTGETKRGWIGGAAAADTTKTKVDFMKNDSPAFVAFAQCGEASGSITCVGNVGSGAFAGSSSDLADDGSTGSAFATGDSGSTFESVTLKAAGKKPTDAAAGYYGYYTDGAVAIDKIGATNKAYAIAAGAGKAISAEKKNLNDVADYHSTNRAKWYGPCAAGSKDNEPTSCYCSAAEQTAYNDDTADPKTKGCAYKSGYFMTAFSAVIVVIAYFF
jgi:hypothetical protein